MNHRATRTIALPIQREQTSTIEWVLACVVIGISCLLIGYILGVVSVAPDAPVRPDQFQGDTQ